MKSTKKALTIVKNVTILLPNRAAHSIIINSCSHFERHPNIGGATEHKDILSPKLSAGFFIWCAIPRLSFSPKNKNNRHCNPFLKGRLMLHSIALAYASKNLNAPFIILIKALIAPVQSFFAFGHKYE